MQRDPVADTIKTYERTAEHYYNNSENIARVRPLLDYFIARLPGKRVLEIGCGPGRDAKYLSEHGLAVTGIDLTEHFIEMAANNAPKATFKRMDMRSLDFLEASFDGLWVMASFLHIPKRQGSKTLHGFARVLSPGGLIYISVKIGRGQRHMRKKRYGGGIKFFAYYSQKEFFDLLKANNFSIIKKTVLKNQYDDPFINVFAIKS